MADVKPQPHDFDHAAQWLLRHRRRAKKGHLNCPLLKQDAQMFWTGTGLFAAAAGETMLIVDTKHKLLDPTTAKAGIAEANGFISKPTPSSPLRYASSGTVPLPQNGSRTR